ARQLRQVAGRITSLISPHDNEARQESRRLEHMREVCANVTHFLAPSQHMRDRFVAFGIAPERITCAGYGFDHAPFKKMGRARSDTLRIGFLGTLMMSKAPHGLLEAFSRLPRNRASLELFGAHAPYHGDESYRQTLEPLLGLEGVHLHGPISHSRVPD